MSIGVPPAPSGALRLSTARRRGSRRTCGLTWTPSFRPLLGLAVHGPAAAGNRSGRRARTSLARDTRRHAHARTRRQLRVLDDYRLEDGAVEKTRTSTGCPTATSTLRVYQFRHDRTSQEAGPAGPAHVANRSMRNKVPNAAKTALLNRRLSRPKGDRTLVVQAATGPNCVEAGPYRYCASRDMPQESGRRPASRADPAEVRPNPTMSGTQKPRRLNRSCATSRTSPPQAELDAGPDSLHIRPWSTAHAGPQPNRPYLPSARTGRPGRMAGRVRPDRLRACA